jgi:hypothetical protein
MDEFLCSLLFIEFIHLQQYHLLFLINGRVSVVFYLLSLSTYNNIIYCFLLMDEFLCRLLFIEFIHLQQYHLLFLINGRVSV